MAMSNLYSKIAQMKRNSEPANMSFSQTHWINGEKCNEKLLSLLFSWCLVVKEKKIVLEMIAFSHLSQQ